MNELLTNLILNATSQYTAATKGLALEIINEAMNLYLVLSVLSAMKYLVIFVLYFIIRKYLNSLPSTYEQVKKVSHTSILVVSLFTFVWFTYPHFETISRVLVAPKLFLLTKGVELFKGLNHEKTIKERY